MLSKAKMGGAAEEAVRDAATNLFFLTRLTRTLRAGPMEHPATPQRRAPSTTRHTRRCNTTDARRKGTAQGAAPQAGSWEAPLPCCSAGGAQSAPAGRWSPEPAQLLPTRTTRAGPSATRGGRQHPRSLDRIAGEVLDPGPHRTGWEGRTSTNR